MEEIKIDLQSKFLKELKRDFPKGNIKAHCIFSHSEFVIHLRSGNGECFKFDSDIGK